MPDSTTLFTSIFIVALVFCVGMQLWLARRQVRHVELHRCEVPPHFADRITLPAHRKAADYTIARTRLSMIDTIQDALVLLALTFGGGIAAITAWRAGRPASSPWRDVALVLAVPLVTGVSASPLSCYRTFLREQRCGCERM